MLILIALIVDAYGNIKKEESSTVTVDVLERVVKEWAYFDPEATGYISSEDFWVFSQSMLKIYSEKNKYRNLIVKSKHNFLKELDLVV